MNLGIPFLCLLVLWPVAAMGTGESDRILNASELASLDRENAMWRLLRVEDDIATNVQLLQRKGFTEDEIDSVRERMTTIWDVDLERNYGWLSKEAIARIQEVDRKFVFKLRAVRLFEEVGIRRETSAAETMAGLARDWQRAIRRVLDYREITEFRLMNSTSALAVAKWMKGTRVRAEEFRTLCEWQREFDSIHVNDSRSLGLSQQAGRADGRLQLWEKARALLGDARFTEYLARAEPEFDRMNQAVTRLEFTNPGEALDLWWIRKRFEIARMQRLNPNDVQEGRDAVAAKARALLGPERFELYVQDETARWLRW